MNFIALKMLPGDRAKYAELLGADGLEVGWGETQRGKPVVEKTSKPN